MDSVPTQPGLSTSIDPFANPLDKMGFQNFAVLKIGNVSCPFPLLDVKFTCSSTDLYVKPAGILWHTLLTPFRFPTVPPNKKFSIS